MLVLIYIKDIKVRFMLRKFVERKIRNMLGILLFFCFCLNLNGISSYFTIESNPLVSSQDLSSQSSLIPNQESLQQVMEKFQKFINTSENKKIDVSVKTKFLDAIKLLNKKYLELCDSFILTKDITSYQTTFFLLETQIISQLQESLKNLQEYDQKIGLKSSSNPGNKAMVEIKNLTLL